MDSPTLAIFIPAYNAAATLPGVMQRIPEELWPCILAVFVINDGSRDGTLETADALRAAYPKLRVHHAVANQGYGPTVRLGLEMSRASGCDYAACIHADGQYPPEKLPEFLAVMQADGIDLLQGSRHKAGTARAGGMPLYKIAAGRILTALENLCFGLSMTDYHSGFLIYSRRALETIPFTALSGYFDFDLEAIASARAAGLRIAEKAIPTHYGDEVSYLNPIKYGLRALRVMLRYRLGRYDRNVRNVRNVR